MKKIYVTNPITDELLREGIISTYEHRERRILIGEDGQQYEEIAITLKYKDPRRFIKSFPDINSLYLKVYSGNSKAQMPFILNIAVEKSINKDFVYLGYKDVIKIFESVDLKPITKSQLSKGITWLLENKVVFKSEEQSKYWINTKYIYNGMFARQLKLENENEDN